MRSIDLAVLDLAGTTVQDGGQVADAFASALTLYGVHVTTAEVSRLRGASKRQAIRDLLTARGVAPELCDEVYAAFRDNLERRYAKSAQPVPGAHATFDWLRRNGILIALNTGFDRVTTESLLRALNWNGGTVDVVVCGDDVASGRPAASLITRCMALSGVLDPQRVANVGDTVLDLRAGHAANVRFNIGVLSGAHGRDALAAEPHTHLIESVANLPEVL